MNSPRGKLFKREARVVEVYEKEEEVVVVVTARKGARKLSNREKREFSCCCGAKFRLCVGG